MKFLLDNDLFDGQLLRTVSHAIYGGADLGECIVTARRLEKGDFEVWYKEWYGLAERLYRQAEKYLADGQEVSARDTFLRSSNYFRNSYIFMLKRPVDPRLLEAYECHTSAFRQAAALFTPAAEVIRIPYEDTTLPAYFFKVDDSGQPRPTLILTGGYDSTNEECYFWNAAAALRRGYNCLCFDGPGQGEPLFKQNLYFRPDWEKVVSPVVDYALTRSDVDPARLALVGLSWGGYLAPRAASGEHRLAACVADPGEWDQLTAFRKRLPLPNVVLEKFPGVSQALLKPVFNFILKKDFPGWALRRTLYVHGASTPAELFQMLGGFSLKECADKITCPTLVCQAEEDEIAADARTLYDHLTCPKEFILFKTEDGAGDHCESGARAYYHERMFAWLDRTLNVLN